MPERVKDEEVYVVDTLMFGAKEQTAAFVVDAEKPVVIDAGLQSCAENVLDAIDDIGVDRGDVEYVVATHVHLDHAGGVGRVAEACGNAEVVVHEEGAKYLTDEESAARLVEKVHAVDDGLGDAYGGIDTVDPERVVSVEGGETLDLGDRSLELMETTGHAPHHLSLYDDESEALFVIDEGCAYFEGTETVTTPPPNFDYEKTLESFDRFEEYDPEYLLYGHYGVNYDGADALPRHREALVEWVEEIDEAWEKHGEREAVVEEVLANHPEAEGNPVVRQILRRDVGGVLIYLSAGR